MKIALAQIDPVIGDFEGNLKKIDKSIAEAKALGSGLVIFPEMAITGYPPKDLLEKPDFIQANLGSLERLIRNTKGIGVICGYVDINPETEGNLLYNAAMFFEDGVILQRVQKRLLPTYDVFDERRYFEPGKTCLPVVYKRTSIGITICEDIWNDKDFFVRRLYPLDPVECLIAQGAEIIINISASPYHLDKRETKWAILSGVARKYKVPVLHANQVGGNDSLLFDGLSAVFDSRGFMAACAGDFEEDLISYDTETGLGDFHAISQSTEASVLKALTVGLKDYALKCGFDKAVIGLSGGIDSSLTAYLAAVALGKENVLGVAMPSPYTSRESTEDACRLAKNLGINFKTIPVRNLLESYLAELTPILAIHRGEITEQNIQARIRGNILMAISNKLGHLVLSTGNKSELAVGYCTLYGDMTGGLAAISDVPKTMVYQLARYINREKEIIPQRVLTKAPSAELKPGQLDQDDLPPYEILDQILKEYLESNKGWKEIVDMGFDSGLVKDIISRINRNEYKRQQAPLGLRITTRAFGYGRRYPLAHRYEIGKS